MMHNKQENKVPQKGARLALEAFRKVLTTTMLCASVLTAIVPVSTNAGVISDGISASYTSVQQNADGYYAYGYVTTSKSHTTTSQLKHDSNVIKQKTSVQSTGKVEAQTDTSSKYTSGWTSSVLYHLY